MQKKKDEFPSVEFWERASYKPTLLIIRVLKINPSELILEKMLMHILVITA